MFTHGRRRGPFALIVVALLALVACNQPVRMAVAPQNAAVQLSAAPLATPSTCTNRFVASSLDHTTITSTKIPTLYEANGAGLAANDLDQDGQIDIVLANLAGPSTILWNQGGLRFRTEPLDETDARAVNIVDVDGDGAQDIVFTHRLGKPTYWHNSGQADAQRFVKGTLPDVNNPFYSMNWADLNGDGALDLVAGSYDTELRKEQGAIFDYHGGGVGVFMYLRLPNSYLSTRLATQADALTIALPDLNEDGLTDILVGNDFNRPDAAWLHTRDGWQATEAFGTTSENTMSLDVGDIDNDGNSEMFATDMKPYNQDVQTLAKWLPIMAKMTRPPSSADPQTAENVLQVRGAGGRFVNQAYTRQLDATGWSWSSKFGDLNNDGLLDIYVVNGMIAKELFSHLPGSELVEENQAFRNVGQGQFTRATEWGLGSTASGRGMSMADLDNDGDLDIVINNLMSPAQLFENQLCSGSSLEVELRQPGTPNAFAIGAQLTLTTSRGSYFRTVRAASGYLSGDPVRVHFGVPVDAVLEQLTIRWPGGALSNVNTLTPHTLLTAIRTP